MPRALCIAVVAAGVGLAACGNGGAERAQRPPSAARLPPSRADAPLPAPPADAPVPAQEAPVPELGACSDARQCNVRGVQALRAGQTERAAELFGRACDGEVGQACFRLGEMFRAGKGVKPDDTRANELFTRGCRYGSESACDALGH